MSTHTLSPSPLCEHCEERLRMPGEDYCRKCYDRLAEAADDRRNEDGEQFRGGEAAAFQAEEQARIQREFK
jgi:tRNA(Ile2) C34 agmatinyltransferase TiaS